MAIKLEDVCRPLEKSSGAIVDYFNKNRDTMEFHSFYNFLISPLPKSLINEEPLLKKLHQSFPIETLVISKFKTFTNHRWHIDEFPARGVSVNMLIEHTRSHILWKYKDDSGDLDYVGFDRFHECSYEPAHTWFLFNTQVEHTIFNYEGDRYVFVMKFENDAFDELCFEDILKYYESI